MRLRLLIFGAALALISGCGSPTKSEPETAAETPLDKIPAVYRARFETSKGDFVVEVTKAWAPMGAARFHQLVQEGFYGGARFFRVLPGFVAQWGMSGDPAVQSVWSTRMIPDDPVKQSNFRGYITFAKNAPNTRTTQVFINLGDNFKLDGLGFAPFGKVISGIEVVDSLYSGYGEGAPRGQGPDQTQIAAQGVAYLTRQFPLLDFVRRASIEQ